MNEKVILFESRELLDRHVAEKAIIQVSVGGQRYCLTRIAQRVFVFETKCPHFDHPLTQASVNPYGQVVCPWHGYQFDLGSGNESQSRCRDLIVKEAQWNEDGALVVVL